MKSTKQLFFSGMFFISILFCLQGFTKKEPIKFGFLLANLDNDRWYKDRDFFVEKIKELGGIALVENARDEADRQVILAEELIKQGVKVLTVIPVNGEAAAAIVEVAHKAGVKVIAYDRLIKNCDLDYYVSFNSVKVGEMMADYVTKLKPSGNYCIVNGPTADNNSKLIKEGVMSILQPMIDAKKIKVVLDLTLTRWNDMETTMGLEEYYGTGKEPCDVIVSASDIISVGVIAFLETKDQLGKVLVTGQNADLDACKFLVAGSQTMSVFKSMKKLAYLAAEVAFKLANNATAASTQTVDNGKIKVPSILLEPVLVDKNNIRTTVIADEIWTEEQIYGKK